MDALNLEVETGMEWASRGPINKSDPIQRAHCENIEFIVLRFVLIPDHPESDSRVAKIANIQIL
jgi:hypothetical protein